jgi:hypothetical protein
MRSLLLLGLVLAALPAGAGELTFNFSDSPLDQAPPGFQSTVAGHGKPGDWRVLLDDAAPALEPLTTKAPAVSKRSVLAQVARIPLDDHFPLLVFTGETFGDFTFSTRFKIVGGGAAQMAGVVFRYQDEKNYYTLCASALDNRFWFFKVVNGVRGPLIGPQAPISKGEWHEMAVRCEGNFIECRLDGKELIPRMTDPSFGSGKVGFWTKSDSVSYFADAQVRYERKAILAQRLVDDALKEFPRLTDLKIFADKAGGTNLVVVAGRNEKDLGQPAGKVERDVVLQGAPCVGKGKGFAFVTAPLRDRNGEPIAAVCVTLKSFSGQTVDNIAARAQPVVGRIQAGVQTLEDLIQ